MMKAPKGWKGAKPMEFCWWIFDLLGMEPGDEFHDVFPGSGAVGKAYTAWLHRAPRLMDAVFREAPHWRNPSPLSHYLPADAARKLGVTRQAIKERMDRGTVPVETHEGRRWIPAWWIADQLEAKVEEP